ncbi:ferric reduction oxidase 8 isoform X1 [Tasmannia lanceolata]|uniref:ferric reduction oxidase 8 isoform X1 n=1 Tax=Tasmannia lanceolata TaxID=3420 RepID=UPI004062E828
MAPATSAILKMLMILIFTGWVCVWVLYPTNLWRKSWHVAEEKARHTIFGYYGLNFAVFSFPILAVAMVGLIYSHLHDGTSIIRRRKISIPYLSSPIIIRSPLGVLSGAELLMGTLFVLFLAWTFYSRISVDFKKMTPVRSLRLNEWQYKVMKVGTRSGLLAEACLALLLIPVLRGMAIFQLLGLQFETSVRYHIWLGNIMMLFSMLHGAITMFIWGIKHNLRNEISQWQSTGRVNLAGEIGLAVGLIIWITSLPQIRRKQFELFYYTHHLYTVFIVFFLLHAGDRHFYTVFSGVLLYAIDKIIRIIQSRTETCLISACILPCKAIELTLLKPPGLKYSPTSVIFIKIPSISRFQWHPFSITSSSCMENERISIIVKCQGQWTNELYNKIHAAVDSDAGHLMCLPIAVEGPYGPTSIYYQRYDSLLLVAGGIGITPFLSILHEVAYRNGNKKNFATRVQLIYTVKKSQDLSMLNLILPLLQSQSNEQEYLRLKIFVTQEERSSTTLREILPELSLVQTVFFDTKCSKYTMARPESLVLMAAITALSSVIFFASLLCLNNAFLLSENKATDKKNPSWVSDLLIICSFIIATVSSTLATVLFRWRKRNNVIPPVSLEQAKSTERQCIEARCASDKHEIHYGQRPDFHDILSKFPAQTGGSNIGVLVCGPEPMQESVASLCRQYSFDMGAEIRKGSLSFHSLNFAL